jgi:6-phosphogluconate dehydrogenase
MYIIMGVSGSGKTTIGKSLAKALNIPFYDADDYHPSDNVAKMKAGQSLTDADRRPWLEDLAKHIQHWCETGGGVLACSALKESYRQILLSSGVPVQWIYLKGDLKMIQQRIQLRSGHFMPADLLQSQFGALEEPVYGWHLDSTKSPEALVSNLQKRIANYARPPIGLIGLGVMGKSLAHNMLDRGFRVVVYNRKVPGEETVLKDFIDGWKNDSQLRGTSNLNRFTELLPSPRRLLLMVPAGAAVDGVLESMAPHLSPHDIIVDGGNSHFQDTQNRINKYSRGHISFLGMGISGGESGARWGPSLMPGGPREAFERMRDVLEAISARDRHDQPCCAYIGPDGAGHYVKMVHNGIEYAEMQLIAEVYGLLRPSHSYTEIANLFREWSKGPAASFLLESTISILEKKEGDSYVLDQIVDTAGSKGTGIWSAKAALDLGIPATMVTAAVYARAVSTAKELRNSLDHPDRPREAPPVKPGALYTAYQMARILNHQQGFWLLQAGSDDHQWDLNLSELARIWTNGCIIRSRLMEQMIEWLKPQTQLLRHPEVHQMLKESEYALDVVLETARELGVAVPVLSAAQQYWYGMSTGQSTANLIQAQRDLFGSHRYQRVDGPENKTFHTRWTDKNG